MAGARQVSNDGMPSPLNRSARRMRCPPLPAILALADSREISVVGQFECAATGRFGTFEFSVTSVAISWAADRPWCMIQETRTKIGVLKSLDFLALSCQLYGHSVLLWFGTGCRRDQGFNTLASPKPSTDAILGGPLHRPCSRQQSPHLIDLAPVKTLPKKSIKPQRLLFPDAQLHFQICQRVGGEKDGEVCRRPYADLGQLADRGLESGFAEERPTMYVAVRDGLEQLKALIACMGAQIAQ